MDITDHSAIDSTIPNKADSQFSEFIKNIYYYYKKVGKIISNYKLLYIIVFLSAILYTLYKYYNRASEFTSKITFTLYEDAQSSSLQQNIPDIANLNLSTLVASSIDIFKLQDIAFSQKVLSKLLFSKCIIRNKEDYFINHYYRLIINSSINFRDFHGLSNLTRQEFKQYMIAENALKNITKISFTDGNSYYITVNTSDEEVTKILSELFYQSLSNYYIEKATEKAYRNYTFLRNRLDSLSNAVYSTDYDIADFQDRSNNLLLSTARVPQNRKIENSEINKTLYLETLKNYENSRVTLNNVTPLFQILTRPYYPLTSTTETLTHILLINALIFFVVIILLTAFLFIYYYYWADFKNIIKEANKDYLKDSKQLNEYY
jgi:uncharacterized protein involved in exopolysaccharide biosynthesis